MSSARIESIEAMLKLVNPSDGGMAAYNVVVVLAFILEEMKRAEQSK